MSVSDPLIKDIKGCTLKLFTEFQNGSKITDSNQTLLDFCHILEKIFSKGLIQNHSFYGNKKIDPYSWMYIKRDQHVTNFNYNNSVEEVQNCKSIHTPLGKFRLLARHCLVKKCLHVPLEYLNSTHKSKIYETNSILGDEILSEILYSVLLQCSKISFCLQLDNFYFLDSSWQLPEMVKLEVVPCKSLGISISFSDNKAVIVHVRASSVASEFVEISIGDILANLNRVEINSSCKGRLNTILQINKGQPINLVIIKAFQKQSQDIFPPIKAILLNLQIDVNIIKPASDTQHIESSGVSISKTTKSGYSATYLGFVDVGNNGSVKQIEEALRRRLVISKVGLEEPVIFEIGEMSVKVFNVTTNDIILKHSYMQISSCGSAPNQPNYVAYIAGDENCDTASKFTCYIFHVKDTEDACTILQSIGQGFFRTHFAV